MGPLGNGGRLGSGIGCGSVGGAAKAAARTGGEGQRKQRHSRRTDKTAERPPQLGGNLGEDDAHFFASLVNLRPPIGRELEDIIAFCSAKWGEIGCKYIFFADRLGESESLTAGEPVKESPAGKTSLSKISSSFRNFHFAIAEENIRNLRRQAGASHRRCGCAVAKRLHGRDIVAALLGLFWRLLREARLKVARGRSWQPEIGMEHAPGSRRSGNKGVGGPLAREIPDIFRAALFQDQGQPRGNSGMTMLFFFFGGCSGVGGGFFHTLGSGHAAPCHIRRDGTSGLFFSDIFSHALERCDEG